ncbi:dynamin family protein [Armatimonas sp.]|uniref:dynamin family protein n=1 Tax=Armatimonas sp. TaxID=1872638 RepID=UPI0037502AF5
MPNEGRLSRARLKEDLRRLEALLHSNGLEADADKVRDKLRDLASPDEILVFVVGEGNFGKSSLVNAVLGRDVAPVSFLPKTWRVDLYRGLPEGADEFAILRRIGQVNGERMSVAAAEVACADQEREIARCETEALQKINESRAAKNLPPALRADLYRHTEPIRLPDQVVEVQWHRSGLALPPEVVLVDTPGFKQVRSGMGGARTEMLGGSEGVTFALEEIYEQFYHRATLVLWAFRADKLNDADTIEVFDDLLGRGKDVLGVITYADKVPPERRQGELLPRAYQYFGKGVTGFIPIISAGSSPEKGLGIPELRNHLTALGPRASAIKQQETESFLGVQARFAAKHLRAIGDNLINNVTQLSLYCNATSERLLREVKTRHSERRATYLKRIGLKSDDLGKQNVFDSDICQKIANLLVELANHDSIRFSLFGVSGEKSATLERLFQSKITEILLIEELSQDARTDLGRVGDYVRAQGSSIAAGQRLQQVVLQSGGRAETRQLDARIFPPDIKNLTISMPYLDMPQLPGGFSNNIKRVFGAANVEQQVIVNTLNEALSRAEQIVKSHFICTRKYTVESAEAILASADGALKTIYPDDSFHSLRTKTERLDGEIDQLDTFVRTFGNGHQESSGAKNSLYRYGTLFRIWSPRDDIRAAAIDLFCEWFSREWPQYHDRALGRISPILEKNQINLPRTQKTCSQLLASQKSIIDTLPDTLLGNLSRQSPGLEELLSQRRDSVTTKISSGAPLFDDKVIAKQILQDFDYMSLDGVAVDITAYVAQVFRDNDSKYVKALPIPQIKSKSTVRLPLRKTIPASVIPLLCCGGLAEIPMQHLLSTAITGGKLFIFGFPPLMTAVVAPIIILILGHHERLSHRNDISKQLVETLAPSVTEVSQASWERAVRSIDAPKVREIVGRKTLVQKRPLDFALEGAFDNYK